MLVLIPFALLASAQLCWLADVLERDQLRVVAISVARYAALADVTPLEADQSLKAHLASFVGATGTVGGGSSVVVDVKFPSHQWLPWNGRLLEVKSYAQKELPN